MQHRGSRHRRCRRRRRYPPGTARRVGQRCPRSCSRSPHRSRPCRPASCTCARPPAMPITRQPLILAICPTTEPVAPAAPETTTVSAAFGSPISSNPKKAVIPVVPSAEIASSGGVPTGTFWKFGPAAHSCQPVKPLTRSPGTKPSRFDSTTSPIADPRITSPMPTGGM